MQSKTKPLTGMRVAILATNNFEQVELTEPRKALEQAGAETVLISNKPGQVQGVNNDDAKADRFPVQLTLEQAKPSDFDGVLLPGGTINADTIRMNEKAREFVQQIDKSGRPLVAICHAPWLLVSAGLVKGRKLTSYYSIQDDVRNAGGNWIDQEFVRDGNLATSRSPQDLQAFNSGIVNLFAEYKQKGVLGKATAASAQDVISR
jgi:intracellular protease, PfpI family